MEANKEYRFKDNPKEKKFFDKFSERFLNDRHSIDIHGIVFGWEDANQMFPKDWLDEREVKICNNLIQWLGSPVGQGFLRECGFVPENKQKP